MKIGYYMYRLETEIEKELENKGNKPNREPNP
jgi:hypothetical protein